jgi:hypothetical protein
MLRRTRISFLFDFCFRIKGWIKLYEKRRKAAQLGFFFEKLTLIWNINHLCSSSRRRKLRGEWCGEEFGELEGLKSDLWREGSNDGFVWNWFWVIGQVLWKSLSGKCRTGMLNLWARKVDTVYPRIINSKFVFESLLSEGRQKVFWAFAS